MKGCICWHCGKDIPKNKGEAVWVIHDKTGKIEFKVILHTPCFLKIGGIV